MKYRIVKTEEGSFRIQQSLLGIFWCFCVEPVAYYSEYENGFVQETIINMSFLYDTKKEAEKTIEKFKEGSSLYRKYSIDLLFINDYGKYECKYFVTKGFFSHVYERYFDTLEEAKDYIDLYWERKEKEERKNKVKEVVKYY